MTPAELAKSGTEHGEQRALFAWARMAEPYGFDVAWDERSYSDKGFAAETAHAIASGQGYDPSVPELEWLHAIPNGGSRGDDKKSRSIQGAKMKAEGVKRGICDVFLPLTCKLYAGLYVELKRVAELVEGVNKPQIINRAAGIASDDQTRFISHARSQGYAVSVCFGWEAAATDIQKYIEMVRTPA